MQLNGCGISPIDSYAYCVAATTSTEAACQGGCGRCQALIRFGSQHADPSDASFDYVALLPCTSGAGIVNAGGFDIHGNFHFFYKPNLGNKVVVLTGTNRPDRLTPTSTIADPSLADLSTLSGSGPTFNGADVVTKEINGETIGIVQITAAARTWAYRLSPTLETWSIRVDSTLKV